MLTVDYDRLGLRAGERLLDLGCGFGRHAFEAARRGAGVVACDLAHAELVEVRSTYAAMAEAGELDASGLAAVTRADATALPFDDDAFDRVIASEVLEHVPDDAAAIAELVRVLRPGGVLAVTVPAYFPEAVCWRLSEDYHAPRAEGGHVRIYRRADVVERLEDASVTPTSWHSAHALHSPYWWLRCAVGVDDDDHVLVRGYRRILEWDIVDQPFITRFADRALNPVLGKSLVVYAQKPERIASVAT